MPRPEAAAPRFRKKSVPVPTEIDFNRRGINDRYRV